jgi:hypothetical protein
MVKQIDAANVALEPLLVILAIIVCSTILFLVYQISQGTVSCNIGYFPGVQGRVELGAEELDKFPRLISQTIKFVEQAKTAVRNTSKSMKSISKYISGLKGPQGQYIISYTLGPDQSRDDHWQKGTPDDFKKGAGTLFAHGTSDGFCDQNQPFCDDQRSFAIGENQWNVKNQSGFYPIRDWIKVAKQGGGWIGSFWRNGEGVIQPKYTYITVIPEKNILLASSFFAARKV